MKKLLKILSLVLVLAIAAMPTLFAAVPFTAEPVDVEGTDQIANYTGMAMQILTFAGYGIAVVMILWLGIQWILATPAKKAELKGKLWSMAIGIFLLVGGTTVLGIVWGAFDK